MYAFDQESGHTVWNERWRIFMLGVSLGVDLYMICEDQIFVVNVMVINLTWVFKLKYSSFRTTFALNVTLPSSTLKTDLIWVCHGGDLKFEFVFARYWNMRGVTSWHRVLKTNLLGLNNAILGLTMNIFW